MSDSILKSTKKALDVPEDYGVFDGNIIMHINSVFSTLNQLGIGPSDGFEIEDDVPTWTQYLQGSTRLNFVKTYMYLRVRYLFDPPATSFVLTAMKEQIAELEWRINEHRELIATYLLGGHKRIVGNLGDEHRLRLANPSGQTLINATGTYFAEFVPRAVTPVKTYTGWFVEEYGDPQVVPASLIDDSQKASGVLFLNATIKTGTYTVYAINPRRTILVIEVIAQ